MENATKNQDGRHLRSKQTRQKLLEAARDIFLQEGFQNTTIKQIIKLANTGYGTAYTHFTGKDDLLIVLMEDVMQKFFDIADISFYPSSKEEARRMILDQVHTFFQIAESERDMMKVFSEAMGLSSAINAKWEQIRHKLIQSITNDITYSQQHGLARSDLKAELVARQWFYANEMYQWEIVFNRHGVSLDEIAKTITIMYTDALYL
ncbi:TetR/AcrR family transcriptional regulator [Paenibacillus pini]|uniref:Transcriptional regulator n=1 Tax=Paenibacillus pini JCM 16418 TaxID=1236976 RepID=W7Z012_9BACL|nr:TetR/AcrR family transcriptional regulator [Paenibacillus pini]GAF07969.1 transcriptional regulator [Paenibacillus pini JCM 16418]